MRPVFWVFVPVMLAAIAAACGDAARADFEAAAQQDQNQQQSEAVDGYIKAHAAAPDSKFGKLAMERAKVLLLELGAQQLQAEQWAELETTADKLLKVDPSSGAAYIYKGYAAYGKGEFTAALDHLKKVQGEPRGVAPPTEEAVQATAHALFSGAEAGARSALGGSFVDAQFLGSKHKSLSKRIEREKAANERRGALLKEGTVDSMANLLHNYPDSAEAKQVREPYAKALVAKLASVEKVGPPTLDDPDPIATVVDSLKARAPEETVTKAALGKVKRLRKAWEERFEEEIETVDEQLGAHQKKAMDKIATVIRDKCVPLRNKLKGGKNKAVVEQLAAAREEAAKLIPNGLTQQDLNEFSLLIIANCSPPTKN